MSAIISDKDLMQDLLSKHKFMAANTINCILEAVNDQLRQDYTKELDKTLRHQKMIFDVMNQRGWYNVQAANPQDVAQAQSRFSMGTQF